MIMERSLLLLAMLYSEELKRRKLIAYSTSRMVYTSVGGYGVTYHSYVAREFRNRKETSKGKES